VQRAVLAAERRHAAEVEAWLIARLEEAAELLGKPAEETTFDDVERCGELYGHPDPHDEPPQWRVDLRFGPRRPVVIRRRR
jgi:hypothetical protein